MPKYHKTRKSALKSGAVYYKTGSPCSRGHISPRFTSTGRCVECNKINNAWRRVSIKQRTPAWANLEDIQKIYELSSVMGEEYVVDHIIPLNGDVVSGLHCPENLAIITSSENSRKQNNFDIMGEMI